MHETYAQLSATVLKHLSPWTLPGLLLAVVVLAYVVGRFLPHKRRRLRAAVLPLLLLFVDVAVAMALDALGGEKWAEIPWLVEDLLVALAVINLCAIAFFDVTLTLLRFAVPGIVTDLVMGLALLVAFIHGLHGVGVSISGIIATSAVVSGVLGISLAPTIGNILGGVALQLDNSIHEGDWVQLENGQQGLVKEIRWRHTVVETRNWDTFIVPNNALLQSHIWILGKRQDQPVQRRYWVYFNVDYRYQPGEVINAVNEALQQAPIQHVAREPRAHCICYDFAKDGRDSMGYYAVRFWLTNLAYDDPTCSVVRERIYTALQRNNIPLAVPAQTLFLSNDDPEHQQRKDDREQQRRVDLLARLELFRALTDEERSYVARRMRSALFATGEPMTMQGRTAHYLYILARGSAEVTAHATATAPERKVATLVAPDIFGEIGMMTGEPRAATVTATSPAECYRLDKQAFEKILSERKELAVRLSEVLARRRSEQRHVVSDGSLTPSQLDADKRHILKQIERFFGLSEER